MTTTTATAKLLPYEVTVNGSFGIVMATSGADAITRSISAIERNRDFDPEMFEQIAGRIRIGRSHRRLDLA